MISAEYKVDANRKLIFSTNKETFASRDEGSVFGKEKQAKVLSFVQRARANFIICHNFHGKILKFIISQFILIKLCGASFKFKTNCFIMQSKKKLNEQQAY